MIRTLHEREVGARFDVLHDRFRPTLPAGDARLRSIECHLRPVRGLRLLDLGCGKGRFAHPLRERGASVVGLDLSAGMLAEGAGLDRVHGSALRLPFATGAFDGVFAVEVFQHLPRSGVDEAIAEVARVLRPGGAFVLIDRNALALDARRPWIPATAVKWVDERRGRWMYPARGPVREHWFRPADLRRRLERQFAGVVVDHLLSADESRHGLFRRFPALRTMAVWTGRRPGGRP